MHIHCQVLQAVCSVRSCFEWYIAQSVKIIRSELFEATVQEHRLMVTEGSFGPDGKEVTGGRRKVQLMYTASQILLG